MKMKFRTVNDLGDYDGIEHHVKGKSVVDRSCYIPIGQLVAQATQGRRAPVLEGMKGASLERLDREYDKIAEAIDVTQTDGFDFAEAMSLRIAIEDKVNQLIRERKLHPSHKDGVSGAPTQTGAPKPPVSHGGRRQEAKKGEPEGAQSPPREDNGVVEEE